MTISRLKGFAVVVLLAGAWTFASASEVVFQGQYSHYLLITNLSNLSTKHDLVHEFLSLYSVSLLDRRENFKNNRIIEGNG